MMTDMLQEFGMVLFLLKDVAGKRVGLDQVTFDALVAALPMEESGCLSRRGGRE